MNYILPDITEELTESISDTFENLFFSEVENCISLDEIEIDVDCLVVKIDTLTPFNSTIGLIVEKTYSEEIALEIAGGEVDAVSMEVVKDTLNEIGNTIVGRFLSRVVPEDEEFSLGFPQCEEWNAANSFSQKSDSRRMFALEMDETTVYCIINMN